MITSIKKIEDLTEFRKGEGYVLSILSRKKNNADITHSKEIMRRKILTKKEDIPEAYEYLKEYATRYPEYEFYMYLSATARDVKQALFHYIGLILDTYNRWDEDGMENRIKKISGLFYKAMENPKARGKVKWFVVDVDTKDKTLLEEMFRYLQDKTEVAYLSETRNGFHLKVKPFDGREFTEKYKEYAEIKKDALIFIEDLGRR